MALSWRKCPICNGTGQLTITNSRKQVFTDKNEKCFNCKGRGEVYVKVSNFFNPWNPFRKDD